MTTNEQAETSERCRRCGWVSGMRPDTCHNEVKGAR